MIVIGMSFALTLHCHVLAKKFTTGSGEPSTYSYRLLILYSYSPL